MGLVKGWDIHRCGLLGNTVASQCVTAIGATAGMKSIEETMRFIGKYTNWDAKGDRLCRWLQ